MTNGHLAVEKQMEYAEASWLGEAANLALLLGHADGGDGGIGEDRARNDAMIDRAKRAVGEAFCAAMPPSWLPTGVAI